MNGVTKIKRSVFAKLSIGMCIFSLLKLLLCSVMAELYQLLGRLSSITDDLCVVMYDVCENYY